MSLFKKNTDNFIRNKSNSKKSSALFTFTLFVIAAIFIMSVAFRVNNITVNGNEHYTDDEIIKAIDIEEGDNLFFFDRFAAVSRVFAKLPYVEEVSITRHLPDRVIIEVSESRAIAYIKMGAELWTIDHNCKLLGKAAEGEDIELISVIGFNPGTFYIGEYLTQDDGLTNNVEFLNDILNQLQDRGISSYVTEINMTNLSSIYLKYGGKYKIILGDTSSLEKKLSMSVAAISLLKDGDIGILDVSDGIYSKFSPY